MKIIALILITFLSLMPTCSLAATLKLDDFIQPLVVNMEEVSQIPDNLPEGLNQIVVRFEGRIHSGSKKEAISTSPHIITVVLKEKDVVDIHFLPKDLRDYERRLSNNESLFKVTVNSEPSDSIVEILPGKSGFLPYGDLGELVKSYNLKNGIVLESGKVRALKHELEMIGSESSPNTESETSLQLKLWYTRATPEEKKHFQDWMSKADKR
ncbi:DUF2057 family protein [Vibrio navarrensis]|uniref:DUF2057 family protein n=1 Tax=Vibrio navarrensis TaxID=29495 RepID=UPI00130218B7|nr:DUF2057 family protein [Vibrio navarrensis]EJL6395640.1 DUF2057 family protein [Vibrio navarrensis]EJL6398190.1 DUF2057 family protein [Vibrio navarrensis]EJL6565187.1 DUF2057 family protein [Vibrio navarrensis]